MPSSHPRPAPEPERRLASRAPREDEARADELVVPPLPLRDAVHEDLERPRDLTWQLNPRAPFHRLYDARRRAEESPRNRIACAGALILVDRGPCGERRRGARAVRLAERHGIRESLLVHHGLRRDRLLRRRGRADRVHRQVPAREAAAQPGRPPDPRLDPARDPLDGRPRRDPGGDRDVHLRQAAVDRERARRERRRPRRRSGSRGASSTGCSTTRTARCRSA